MSVLLAIPELSLVEVSLSRDHASSPMEFIVAEPALIESPVFLHQDTSALTDVCLALTAFQMC